MAIAKLKKLAKSAGVELVAAASALVLVSLFAAFLLPSSKAQNNLPAKSLPPQPTATAPTQLPAPPAATVNPAPSTNSKTVPNPVSPAASGQTVAPGIQVRNQPAAMAASNPPAPALTNPQATQQGLPPASQPAPSQAVPLPDPNIITPTMPGQNLGTDPASSILISTPPIFPVSPEQYVFNPENRRDPFEPYRGIIPITKVGTDGVPVMVVTDPLLMYEVEEYSIVGILWNVKVAKVMVKEPKGAVFVLAKGAKLGKRNGYIHEIREGGVIVKETFDTEVGKKIEYKSLALKR